ncbi:DMT family transporter [Bacteroidota bacterium]
MKINHWLVYALVTTLFWGVWGAFIEIPEKNGFPATLSYTVWAFTMLIPAAVGLWKLGWKIKFTTKSIIFGGVIGLLGAGGQLILLTSALMEGPAYLIFPIISLSPVITIIMAYFLLNERANYIVWIGILLALASIPLLSYMEPESSTAKGLLWLVYALLIFFAWGVQAFFMKLANQSMKAEEIFFYMMLSGVLLIPIALWMTDFDTTINFGFDGIYLAAIIQTLNSVGALCLVYAFRYGKGIVVSPMTNAVAPLLTVVISLIIYQHFPHNIVLIGMILALVATLFIAIGEEFKSKS